MEASQLFLGSSSGAGTQALAEGVPVQSAAPKTDATLNFLALIKAGLKARQDEEASQQNSLTTQIVPTEPLPETLPLTEVETSSESDAENPELAAEMVQSLIPQPNCEIPLCPNLETPPIVQTQNALLETLFSQSLFSQDSVLAEHLPNSDISLKELQGETLQQSQSNQNLDLPPDLKLDLKLDLNSLMVSETEQILPSDLQVNSQQVTQSNQKSPEVVASADTSLDSETIELQNPQLTDLEGKQSPSGTDTQIARHQLEQNQVKQNQVDYWQNLFRTLSHSPVEVSDPQAIQTQQSTESTPAPLAWLLSSLNTGLQNLSQLTNPLQPFLNQQNLSFATDIRSLSGQSDHALKHSLVLQELQTQSPILTTDSANLSLETQDFTQQQETNGFWPRATELSFATQTPRSEASAELAQTNTSAALHELGERFALVKQLSQRVQLLNQRDRSIELALEPAHLGKLTLRLQQSAQQLNLQIFTELALTKDLIESHLQQLRNQLQAQGFDVQQIQVQLQPDNQFSQNSSSGQQQESRQGPASNAFDLFQSEEMEPETNSEPLQTHVDIKFNHQINTLV